MSFSFSFRDSFSFLSFSREDLSDEGSVGLMVGRVVILRIGLLLGGYEANGLPSTVWVMLPMFMLPFTSRCWSC